MLQCNRWFVLGIVSSALLIISIDMTVLYTALPRLTHDLAASAAEKIWIMNAYALLVAGLLPGSGTLGDRIGHKRMMLIGLLVFGTASILAACSPTPGWLIAARALLGVGAAIMMPATLSIIRLTFSDKKERAFAIGMWGAVASGGAALGPVVGGVLLEYFWWGSVFLINVPVVVLAIVATFLVITESERVSVRPWDVVASAQVMAGLVGVFFAIKEISRPASSYGLAGAAGLAGFASLVLFFKRQKKSPHPLIEFSLFRDDNFFWGVTVALVSSAILIGIELAMSQRLQLVKGLSPILAGLSIVPIPLTAFICGPLAGLSLTRYGARRIMWVALMACGIGVAGILLTRDAGGAAQIMSLCLVGMGLGASMSTASTSIMSNAPADKAGMAAAVEEVSYELGGAMGVAVFGSLLTTLYTVSLVLPADLTAVASAYDSLDSALLASESLPAESATVLIELAKAAFEKAFKVALGAASALALFTGLAVATLDRKRLRAVKAVQS